MSLTLSDEEVAIVRSCLRTLIGAIKGSSGDLVWTATDEFTDAYLRTMRILDGRGDPGADPRLLR